VTVRQEVFADPTPPTARARMVDDVMPNIEAKFEERVRCTSTLTKFDPGALTLVVG
jgi:hypothetical protein